MKESKMADEGKFIVIRSLMHDKVLTVKDGAMNDGQPVCPFTSSGSDNQLWYEDRIAGVIRCKKNDDFCLEMQGDELVINTYNPDEHEQKWKIAGQKIIHREEDDRVLDIAAMDDSDGARVCAYEFQGSDNQMWSFEHVPIVYCYIRCSMDGRVFDVRDADPNPGAKLITWSKHDDEQENQLWFEDKYGNIRSKLNPDHVLDTTEGSARLQPYDPDVQLRKWVKSGRRVANREDPTLVLQVKEAGDQGFRKHFKGRKIDAGQYIAQEHQVFFFDYI